MDDTLLSLIRDPAVVTLVGAAAVLAPFVIALISRRTRRLAYHYSTTPLVSVHDDVADDVHILFGDREIKNLQLVLVEIVNIGRLSILPQDFESSPVILFEGTPEILSASVLTTHPSDLRVNLTFDKSSGGAITNLRFQPLLLNNGDGFRLKCLIAANPVRLDVSARIAGVRRLDWFDLDIEGRSQRMARAILFAVFAVGTAILGGVLARFADAITRVIGTAVIALLGLGVGVVLSVRLTRFLDPWRKLR